MLSGKLSKMIKNNKHIAIIFLVYNGLNDHFQETMEMVQRQNVNYNIEIIVIDSGSTDGTVEFVKKSSDITLYQIAKSEFGHGKTRQMGAQLAHGEFVVFLTQDATPADDQWLKNLVKKIESDDRLMAVCSRVLPRNDAMTIRKYGVMAEWCAGEEDFVVSGEDAADYRIHDISTIYRRDFLLEHHFDDVAFGEDVLIAKKILENGFSYGFASESVVKHSHDYTIKKTYKRNIEDGKFNRQYLHKDTIESVVKIFGVTCKLIVRDLRLLKNDPGVTFGKKIVNILYSPIIHFAEALGQYKGNKL